MRKEKSVEQDKKIQQLMEKKKDEVKALKKLLDAFNKAKSKNNNL